MRALPGRRRLRRRLLVAGLLPLLLALAFSVKVATMVHADRSGRAAYGDGDFSAAHDRFAANRTLNELEPWLSPYDEGTARYRLGDFAGAARRLQEALGLAPIDQACRVLINLALAHEALGDSALADGAPAEGRVAWQAGVETLEAGLCLTHDPGTTIGSSSATQAGDALAIDTRLRDKLSDPEASDDEAAELPEQQQAAAELLAELNERAERRRQQAAQDQQDKDDQAVSPSSPADPEAPPAYQW